MTDLNKVPETPKTSEFDALKTRADRLGIKYHPNISLDKLRERVNAKLNNLASEPDEIKNAPDKETKGQRISRMRKDANKLVRVVVNSMNPNTRNHEGQYFTVGNSVVGSFTKYVPYNVEWHIPQIIYNHLIERKCQVFYTARNAKGKKIRQGKLIPEFSVEVLPDLTAQQIKDLAVKQAMAQGQAE